MADSAKPWVGKPQISSVKSVHQGMRSPLNKGHTAPLPKNSNTGNGPPKK